MHCTCYLISCARACAQCSFESMSKNHPLDDFLILRKSGSVMHKFWSEEILIATIPWQQSLDVISHVFYAVEKAFCICILQQADSY